MILLIMVRRIFSRLPVNLRLVGVPLLLLACCGPARAGYVPGSVTQLVDEFNAFAGDFLRWNAQNNNMPLLTLEFAPAQERMNVLVWLWWMWLNNPGTPISSPPSPGLGGTTPIVSPGVGPSGLPPSPIGGTGTVSGGDPPSPGGSPPQSGPGTGGGSLPGQSGPGTGGGSSPGLTPPGSGKLPLLSVPEPSSFVLASCGALALLIARRARRKSRPC